MERLVPVDRARLAEALRRETEPLRGPGMDAGNAAQDGRWIQDREGPVLEWMRDFQKRIFEKALQGRIDSTESSRGGRPGCWTSTPGANLGMSPGA